MKINEYLDSFDANFCDAAIAARNETGKALKDIVGKKYEEHRKYIWEASGYCFQSRLHSQDKDLSAFNADGYIYGENGKLLVIEEAKAHYVDSCFLERALGSFAKQIRAFLKNGWNEKDVPYFVLSSTTTYNLYQKKLEEYLDVLLDANPVKKIMRKKLRYFTVTANDRIKPKGWLQNTNRPVSRTPETKALVKKELKFMEGLQ
jgi:hypothetical protein